METLERVHGAQESFRIVLDAMARPGRVEMLPDMQINDEYPSISSPLAILIDMFVDQATTFCTASEGNDALERAIVINTHARKVSPREADYMVVPGSTESGEAERLIGYAQGGTLLSPEEGATILMGCKRICSQDKSNKSAHWVSIEGPGVQSSHIFGIDRIDWAWARNRREDEFPCGIEIILVDEEGRVVAIPRTSFVSLLAVEKGAN